MDSNRDFSPSATSTTDQKELSVGVLAKAHGKCTQCGKTMRHMPLFLNNITCRDCYGMERYRRAVPGMIAPDRSLATSTPDETVTS